MAAVKVRLTEASALPKLVVESMPSARSPQFSIRSLVHPGPVRIGFSGFLDQFIQELVEIF